MKILISGSMQFSEQMLAAQQQLESLGHDVTIPSTTQNFIGKNDVEKGAAQAIREE